MPKNVPWNKADPSIRNPTLLRKLYIEDKLSSCDVAKVLGISVFTVLAWLKEFGIPSRSPGEANRISIPKRTTALALECPVCGRHFTRRISVVKPYKTHYCSKTCMGQVRRGVPIAQRVGVNNAKKINQAKLEGIYRNHPRVDKICLNCGRPFVVQYARRNAKYCCFACHAEGQWKDPAYRAAMQRKPTQPEQRIIEIITKYFPEFKYNGSGDLGVILARLVPDFVNVNGKKQVIEVFGDYYHGRLAKNWKQTELGKTMAYNSIGYDCLVLWESEIKSKSEEELVEIIRGFASKRHKKREVA